MLAGTKIRYRPEVRGRVDVIQAALFDLLLILTEQSELAIRRVSPRSVSRSRRPNSGKNKDLQQDKERYEISNREHTRH
ncbi:hypothetical protein D3C81_2145830 [compost metagenome]